MSGVQQLLRSLYVAPPVRLRQAPDIDILRGQSLLLLRQRAVSRRLYRKTRFARTSDAGAMLDRSLGNTVCHPIQVSDDNTIVLGALDVKVMMAMGRDWQ
jgi:hypothetical protein